MIVSNASQSSLARQIGKRGPFESPAQEAYLNLLRTHEVLASQFADLFKSEGLTDAQYNILRILRGHGSPLPVHQIASQMITRVPDVTRLVDRMEKAGLARRQRCPTDRRVVFVEATRKGLNTLKRLDRPVRRLHERQMRCLSERQLQRLSRLLTLLRDNAEPEPGGTA